MEIKALALDQAPRDSGWAVGSPDSRPPVWGHWRLQPWSEENEGLRLNQFEDRVTGVIEKYRVTHVFYEALYPIIQPRDFAVRENQAKVVGAINSICARRKLPCHKIIIADWRMRFVGLTKIPGLKGDAGREELKRRAMAACAKRGWYCDQPDAAEALGLLNFGLSVLDQTYEHRDNPLMRRAQSQADEQRRAGL